jgi:hypothetical protein
MNKEIDVTKDLVVRSPKLPAERPASPKLPAKPPAVQWREFNQFASDAKDLREYYDDLCKQSWSSSDELYLTPDDVECAAEEYDELLGEVRAGFERFERAENYEDDDKMGVLKHSHVAKRIGVLLGSFPNANPHAPDGYPRMLIEHVAAIPRLTNVALESACREIVETQKFAPAISEVVTTIRKHIEQWQRRRMMIGQFATMQKNMIKRLREREAEAAKQKQKDEISKARWAVSSHTRVTEQLAQAIERVKADIETAKAKLTTLIEQHSQAEKRRTEAMCALIKLTGEVQAAATEAAAKHNGAGDQAAGGDREAAE